LLLSSFQSDRPDFVEVWIQVPIRTNGVVIEACVDAPIHESARVKRDSVDDPIYLTNAV
jgi:hypothetical protein